MVRLVKIASIIFICVMSLNASTYETNCLSCHKKLPVSIDKYFYRYLLKYSSEKDVKNAMIGYMISPTKEKSVMSNAFLERFGVKKASSLSKKELENAINKYWEEYKVFEKLK